jgi:hypothetical protein
LKKNINGLEINTLPNEESTDVVVHSEISSPGNSITNESTNKLQSWVQWLIVGLSLVLGGTLLIVGALLWRRYMKKQLRQKLKK